jgi:V/A-type H+/Na+-transporting ATPase subunit D
MKGPAIRSRVLELQHRLAAARHGRELLDQKREALQRELSVRLQARGERRARAAAALARARSRLAEARIETGTRNVGAAALAQASPLVVTRVNTSLVGVPVPRLVTRTVDFRLQYTFADTAASLDDTAQSFASALADIVGFAQEDSAVRHLRVGLARTTRRLNALDLMVIPEIVRELREVTAALEEEERDETLRRKRWLGARER